MPTLKDLENDQIKWNSKMFKQQNEILLLALRVAAYEYSLLDKKVNKKQRRAQTEVFMARWLRDAEDKVGEEQEITRKQRKG